MIAWIIAIVAAAFLAFIVGGVWYGALFGGAAASLSPAYAQAPSMSPATVAFEGLRCLALALVLAFLVQRTGTNALSSALFLGLIVWAGFQAAGLAGAVVHEGYPFRLYLIHAGDALAKALVVAATLVLMQRWLT